MRRVNVADAQGLTFECKPGCGFCCTNAPLVAADEETALGGLAVRTADGTLRIPIAGGACAALRADRSCGVYAARPTVCRLYPYAVHAGRRIQVTVALACPGVSDAPASGARERMPEGAARAAEIALARPGAGESAARAKETFAEFDRRMKEWGVAAPPDKLRTAFLPHVDTLALPHALPAFFTGLAAGDLALEGDAARVVGALFESEPESDLAELYAEAARDAFEEPDALAWVEPDLSWTSARERGSTITLTRIAPQGRRQRAVDLAAIPLDWDAGATQTLARYLARLLQRDHAEGAAAWLVDASGYQATPAAAYARVLGEASLQVALRAALLAADDASEEVTAEHARRGVMAYETAFHSLPTVGAIL